MENKLGPYLEKKGRYPIFGQNKKKLTTLPTQYQFTKLPFDSEWNKLEELCHELICAIYGRENCSKYGEYGQAQDGFDYFIRHGDGYDLIQVKHVRSFREKDLIAAMELLPLSRDICRADLKE